MKINGGKNGQKCTKVVFYHTRHVQEKTYNKKCYKDLLVRHTIGKMAVKILDYYQPSAKKCLEIMSPIINMKIDKMRKFIEVFRVSEGSAYNSCKTFSSVKELCKYLEDGCPSLVT